MGGDLRFWSAALDNEILQNVSFVSADYEPQKAEKLSFSIVKVSELRNEIAQLFLPLNLVDDGKSHKILMRLRCFELRKSLVKKEFYNLRVRVWMKHRTKHFRH